MLSRNTKNAILAVICLFAGYQTYLAIIASDKGVILSRIVILVICLILVLGVKSSTKQKE